MIVSGGTTLRSEEELAIEPPHQLIAGKLLSGSLIILPLDNAHSLAEEKFDARKIDSGPRPKVTVMSRDSPVASTVARMTTVRSPTTSVNCALGPSGQGLPAIFTGETVVFQSRPRVMEASHERPCVSPGPRNHLGGSVMLTNVQVTVPDGGAEKCGVRVAVL